MMIVLKSINIIEGSSLCRPGTYCNWLRNTQDNSCKLGQVLEILIPVGGVLSSTISIILL